ncbi:hypothetical protein [Reinekea sp. G2M2-21]|uniref:hypothetical protein n=1 Tax=Reinekea sp. G2M2-21 TaxID=2788942 RepID=UPI0018AB6C76|nr:hypothetical protein [Reinekea sp. G2M2-21]
MKHIFILCMLSTGLCCASENNIEIVKNASFECESEERIGQVLDNWNDCKNASWGAFTTESNLQVVEFVCPSISTVKFFNHVKNRVPARDFVHFDIKSYQTKFAWHINSDNTIALDNISFSYRWKDALTFDNKYFGEERNEIHKSACRNKPHIDLTNAHYIDTLPETAFKDMTSNLKKMRGIFDYDPEKPQ